MRWRSLFRGSGQSQGSSSGSGSSQQKPRTSQSKKSGSFSKALQSDISNTMKVNFENKKFLSAVDLSRVISPDTILRLLEDQPTLRHLANTTNVTNISSNASRLLALCVYAGKLQCFVPLLNHGISDRFLPLNVSSCPSTVKRGDFQALCKLQGSFLVFNFQNYINVVNVLSEAVLPLQFDLANEADLIGEGQSGDVFRTRIAEGHYPSTENGPGIFAVKRYSPGLNKYFNHEVNVLKQLATSPHQHIVYHLAAFTQHQVCYILLPYADCNLREFMAQEQTPEFAEAASVLWLLSQTLGLASALSHIHEFTFGGTLYQGWHHDIKPENILVFKYPSSSGRGSTSIFKIADFDTASVQQAKDQRPSRGLERKNSLKSKLENGNITYQSPDYHSNGYFSRPFDVWSMGCIYLELLDWFFIPGPDRNFIFSSQRMNDDAGQDSQYDMFWHPIRGSKKTTLRPSVLNEIRDLDHNHCRGKPAFEDLLSVTIRALELDPAKRILASEMVVSLNKTLGIAKQDLTNDKYCYMRPQAFGSSGKLAKQGLKKPGKAYTAYNTVSRNGDRQQTRYHNPQGTW